MSKTWEWEASSEPEPWHSACLKVLSSSPAIPSNLPSNNQAKRVFYYITGPWKWMKKCKWKRSVTYLGGTFKKQFTKRLLHSLFLLPCQGESPRWWLLHQSGSPRKENKQGIPEPSWGSCTEWARDMPVLFIYLFTYLCSCLFFLFFSRPAPPAYGGF